MLLEYNGEVPAAAPDAGPGWCQPRDGGWHCGACDNCCENHEEAPDLAAPACLFLQAVQACGGKKGIGAAVQVLQTSTHRAV